MNWHGFIRRVVTKTLPEPALLTLKKIYYRSYLARLSESEPDLEVVKRLVGPGDCVIDIGANVGTYTLALSRMVGPTGCVLSFEPIPETFEILRSNVSSFHLKNVSAFGVALSSREGSVTMEIPDWAGGGENYYQSRIVSPGSAQGGLKRVEVTSRQLDEFSANLAEKNLAFVKIDVEGHELDVLRGAGRVLQQHRPAMLVEASGDPDGSEGSVISVFRLLMDMDYSPYWFDGNNLRPRRKHDRSTNYFFLTGSQYERYRNAGGN